MSNAACQFMTLTEAAFGKIPHLCRFIYGNRTQPTVQKEALQVTGTMTKLQNVSPADKWSNASDPVIPHPKRYDPCYQVICEGKGMVQELKEDPHEMAHEVYK